MSSWVVGLGFTARFHINFVANQMYCRSKNRIKSSDDPKPLEIVWVHSDNHCCTFSKTITSKNGCSAGS